VQSALQFIFRACPLIFAKNCVPGAFFRSREYWLLARFGPGDNFHFYSRTIKIEPSSLAATKKQREPPSLAFLLLSGEPRVSQRTTT